MQCAKSGVVRYAATVTGQKAGVLVDNYGLAGTADDVAFHHLHMQHGEIVSTTIYGINGAGSQASVTSNSFVVDLTPPELAQDLFIGPQAGANAQYQTSSDPIQAHFQFRDPESGLAQVLWAVYQRFQGHDTRVYPASGSQAWAAVSPLSATGVSRQLGGLNSGASYYVQLQAVNRAGLAIKVVSESVVIDDTPPTVSRTASGTLNLDEPDYRTVGSQQEYWQWEKTTIAVAWHARDDESGISAVLLAVGTSAGASDVTGGWRRFDGALTSALLANLSLATAQSGSAPMATDRPLYFVSVKAINGAGRESPVATTPPVRVVEMDQVGTVLDGPDPDQDLDWTALDHRLTATFAGFASPLHGITHYQFAIGSSPQAVDSIVPFSSAGILTRGDGTTGMASAPVDLQSGQRYFVTVRAITGAGAILEATSNGLMVDTTPPHLEAPILTPDAAWTSSATVQASWRGTDSESGMAPVSRFAVGTYPGGTNLADWQSTLLNDIPAMPLPPDGTPAFITVQVANRLGLSSTASRGITADLSDPLMGVSIECPSHIVPNAATLSCRWSPPQDPHSRIAAMSLTVLSSPTTDPDDAAAAVVFTAPAVGLQTTGMHCPLLGGARPDRSYFLVLKVTNGVGQQAEAVSQPVAVDASPPVAGAVVELHLSSLYEPAADETVERLLLQDQGCQHATRVVRAAWAGFADADSGLREYRVGLGSTPGATDLSEGLGVVDASTTALSLTGLRLVPGQTVFVVVYAVNGAGGVAQAVSNGITVFSPAASLTVVDGDGSQPHGDQLQANKEIIAVQVELTADACPVHRVEWAVFRLDGHLILPFRTVEAFAASAPDTQAYFTQVGPRKLVLQAQGQGLEAGHSYFSVVRIHHDVLATLSARSDGVTVVDESVPLPGTVYDLRKPDADVQVSTSALTVLWDGFAGEGGDGIDYFEVAIGTNVSSHTGRTNVVPYRRVAADATSVTLSGLNLQPMATRYYATVRAHTTTGASIFSSSDGIMAGFNAPITPGAVQLLPAFQASTSVLRVFWANFSVPVLALNYSLLLHRFTAAQAPASSNGCAAVFLDPAGSVRVQGPTATLAGATASLLTGLSLEHGKHYSVTVLAEDELGRCVAARSATVLIDTTVPTQGRLHVGHGTATPPPDAAAPVYLPSVASGTLVLNLSWTGFTDPESGLSALELQFWQARSCAASDVANASAWLAMTPAIRLPPDARWHELPDVDLVPGQAYFATLAVQNGAGLWLPPVASSAIMRAAKPPTAGRVNTGSLVDQDTAFQHSTQEVAAVLTYAATAAQLECRPTMLPVGDVGASVWEYVASLQLQADGSTQVANAVPYNGQVPLAFAADRTTLGISGRPDLLGFDTVTAVANVSGAERGGSLTVRLSVDPASPEHVAYAVVLADPADPGALLAQLQNVWPAAQAAVQREASSDPAQRHEAGFEYYQRSLDGQAFDPLATDQPTNVPMSGEEVAANAQEVPAVELTGSQAQGSDGNNAAAVSALGVMVLMMPSPAVVAWVQPAGQAPQVVTVPLEDAERAALTDPLQTLELGLELDTEIIDLEPHASVDVLVQGQARSALVAPVQLSAAAQLRITPFHASPQEAYDRFLPPQGALQLAGVALAWNPHPAQQQCGPSAAFYGQGTPLVEFQAALGTQPGATDLTSWTPLPRRPCRPCVSACDQLVCQPSCPEHQRSAVTAVNFTVPIHQALDPAVLAAAFGPPPVVPARHGGSIQPGDVLVLGYAQSLAAASHRVTVQRVAWASTVPLAAEPALRLALVALTRQPTQAAENTTIAWLNTTLALAAGAVQREAVALVVDTAAACGFGVVAVDSGNRAVVQLLARVVLDATQARDCNHTMLPWATQARVPVAAVRPWVRWYNASSAAYTRGAQVGLRADLVAAVQVRHYWQYSVEDFDPLESTPTALGVGGLTAAAGQAVVPPRLFVTVRGRTLAGEVAQSESSSVVLDLTPPGLDFVHYFHPGSSPLLPVRYQAYTTALSMAWGFEDLQSGVAEYRWAVGSAPGATDVVPITSVGQAVQATATGLALQVGVTYYGTVWACNHADLCAQASGAGGVTVDPTAPDLSRAHPDVQGDLPPVSVEGQSAPLLRTTRGDILSIGWSNMQGEIDTIDWTVGTEFNMADVLPPTWVGPAGDLPTGQAGWAEVRQARLFIGDEGFPGRYLGDLDEVGNLEQRNPDLAQQEPGSSLFDLEPGTCLHHRVRAWSPAQTATSLHALICIMQSGDVVVTPVDGGLAVNISSGPAAAARRRRAEDDLPLPYVHLTAPAGSASGTALVVGTLTMAQMRAAYHGGPSAEFRVYVTDPTRTLPTDVSRSLLRRRATYAGLSFYINLPFAGTIHTVLQLQAHLDPAARPPAGQVAALLFFEPMSGVWRQVADSCGHAATVLDALTLEVQLCSTRNVTDRLFDNKHLPLPERYFGQRTQFALAWIDTAFVNTAPRATTPGVIRQTLDADGALQVQLTATDAEHDAVYFVLVQGAGPGQTTLSADGWLRYVDGNCTAASPCPPSTLTVRYQAVERLQHEGKPLSSPVASLRIDMRPPNQRPLLYVVDTWVAAGSNDSVTGWRAALHRLEVPALAADEAERALPLLAAVDHEWDALQVQCAAQHGTMRVAKTPASTASVFGALPASASAQYMRPSWWRGTYHPGGEFTGLDHVMCYAEDREGLLSFAVQVDVPVTDPCANGGLWNGTVCACADGYYGDYCQQVESQDSAGATGVALYAGAAAGALVVVLVAVLACLAWRRRAEQRRVAAAKQADMIPFKAFVVQNPLFANMQTEDGEQPEVMKTSHTALVQCLDYLHSDGTATDAPSDTGYFDVEPAGPAATLRLDGRAPSGGASTDVIELPFNRFYSETNVDSLPANSVEAAVGVSADYGVPPEHLPQETFDGFGEEDTFEGFGEDDFGLPANNLDDQAFDGTNVPGCLVDGATDTA